MSATLRQQFYMGAEFAELPVLQHQHAMRFLNRLQAMGNDDRDANRSEYTLRVLNQLLGFGVDAGGSLIEQEDLRISRQHPRNGTQLALTGAKTRARRHHSEELKARVLAECAEPGASVRWTATKYDLNPNVVQRWRRAGAISGLDTLRGTSADGFVALPLIGSGLLPSTDQICIALRDTGRVANICWPVLAAAACAQCLRELLK